jgi:hypothetical protein
MLPADLRQAQSQALEALHSALGSQDNGRWTVELRFEGLRVLPIALRLAEYLQKRGHTLRLLYPDAGATALARRDAPHLASLIASLGEHRRLQEAKTGEGAQGGEAAQAGEDAKKNEGGFPEGVEGGGPDPAPEMGQASRAVPLLLVIGPGPSDYGLVEAVCSNHQGAVVLLNPTLEDAAVGIGSVARGRRKGFLAQWQAAYALQPFAASALRRAHPGEWELYRLDPDGFRLAGHFPQKPTSEEQEEVLSGEAPGGLKQQLRGLGDLIDNLQR